jgi:(1->4)-alpha-D-glucan 1-alpha-D-glucosylmutase
MIAKPRYVPLSTYRLQLHVGFPFAAAREVAPYLRRLGVDTIYTSPYFTAAPGSTHGYDVVNHNEINPELGGAEGLEAFAKAIASEGLHHIVDFVPNHMGIGTGANAWWMDLLENGPSSPAARVFDIDWEPVRAGLHAKLLLPILGDQYGRVLERGELQLAFRDGMLVLRYFDHAMPITPREAPRVYERAVERLIGEMGANHPLLDELQSIVASLRNLPSQAEHDPVRIAARQREKEVARSRLARLVADSPAIAAGIEAAVREVNGVAGNPSTFDALHDLLESQAYRLSYWRTASHEINYRRFFDVNTLAGLSVEHADVFAATHRLLGSLIEDGIVHAVRVDHPDGLFDPARYFDMLQDLAARRCASRRGDDGEAQEQPLYVVAEKILSGSERLPQRWAVHGTTGYDFLNDLNGIFIDPTPARRARRLYAKLTGRNGRFEDILYACKRLIMETALASELNVLAHMLDRIAEGNRRSRDFTLESLRDVITEVVACFPVYRTYVDHRGWRPEDRSVVEQAIVRARRRNPAMESSLFDFFREVVLPRDVNDGSVPRSAERRDGYPPADEREAQARLRFAMKLQQYTSPVQAKGMEDTAFYRDNVLLSLNEVGGDPSRIGRSVEEFHDANAWRAQHWPCAMLATSTHDTKLGEDVRARINVLSDVWVRHVSQWMRLNRTHRTMVDGELAPDRPDEYRFYQALVGVWPAELTEDIAETPAELVERMSAYMLKSVKEAKVHTSWLSPNQPYEDALVGFIARTLQGDGGRRFLQAFLPLQRRVAAHGMVNSLAQVVLKAGAPGVPDFYQGSELWDLSLVDPDNRRPIDFSHRACLLESVASALEADADVRARTLPDLLTNWRDGRIKLLVTTAALRLRRDRPNLFLEGAYAPLTTEITVTGGAVGFARILDGEAALFIAPRLCLPLVGGDLPVPLGAECWKTSRVLLPRQLHDRTFRHELTGTEIRPTKAGDVGWIFLGDVFQAVPVGILTTSRP